MNARGGRRPGAGRKPLLDEWQRLALGSHCERTLERISTGRLAQQRSDDLAETNLPEHWAWVNAIPVSERKAFLGSSVYKEHSASIQEERKALRLTPINGRYGVRRRVIRHAIEWANSQFGVELKPTFVVDCWEEYRALDRTV